MLAGVCEELGAKSHSVVLYSHLSLLLLQLLQQLTPIGILSGVLLILGLGTLIYIIFDDSLIDFSLEFDVIVSPLLEFFFDVDREQEEYQVGDEKTDLAAAEVLLLQDLETNEGLVVEVPLRKDILE